MNKHHIEYVKQWLIKANEDIDVLIIIASEHPEHYTSAIAFHSQQAVEKFLKSFLVYNNMDIEKTHDVNFLLSECIKIEKSGFEDIDVKNLTDYAVTVRYADDFMIPTLNEVLELKEIAFSVKKIVEEKIILD
jgi:HEPN domain-containing protein